MKKTPQFEYAIICDDIRHEMGDKFSLIGVYGSHMGVARLPFVLPKLSVAVAYRNVQGGDTFSITLKDPSDQTVGEPIMNEVPKELTRLTRFMIFGVFPPMQITQAGLYKVGIVINQDEASKRQIEFAIEASGKRMVH
jgi:hypothetical protein